MITEPNISQNDLIELLNQTYLLQIKLLTFLPKGEVSWVYYVECEDGAKYLLKIHKARVLPPERFQLLSDLHEKADINGITYPLPTKDNKLEVEILGYPSVLLNYIEGKTALETKPTEAHYKKLGVLLAKIHQSIKTVSYPVRETFEIATKGDFLKVVDYLSNTASERDKHKSEALVLLKPLHNRLMEELSNLERLRLRLENVNLDYVLCHGEPSPGNIMVGNDGEVYLIDWDEPIVAPKEKDLLFFAHTIEQVLRGYSQYSTDTTINKDVESFYSLLWNINEVADWGDRIFFSETSKEELKHSLSQLKDFLNYSGLGKSM